MLQRWEQYTYVVIPQPNLEIPVYVGKKENGLGKQRTLQRNLSLPVAIFNSDDQRHKLIPAPRRKSNTTNVSSFRWRH